MATETHNIELVDLRKLTIQQQNAIDLLISGSSDREVAQQVGVDRSTITRWRLYHPAFQAELNAQREAVWGVAKEKLRSLLSQAVDLLAERMNSPAVEDADRIRIALDVLKPVKLGENMAPHGLTDAGTIINKAAKGDPLSTFHNASDFEIEAYEIEVQAALNDTDEGAIYELMDAQRAKQETEEKARKKAAKAAKNAAKLLQQGEPPLILPNGP